MVIITDVGGSQNPEASSTAWSLPLHFTDLQSELPPLEQQQRAAAAAGRVEQVIPQQGARCHRISPHNRPTLTAHVKPITTITSHMANKGNTASRFVINWSPQLSVTLFSTNQQGKADTTSDGCQQNCAAPVSREILTNSIWHQSHTFTGILYSVCVGQGYL